MLLRFHGCSFPVTDGRYFSSGGIWSSGSYNLSVSCPCPLSLRHRTYHTLWTYHLGLGGPPSAVFCNLTSCDILSWVCDMCGGCWLFISWNLKESWLIREHIFVYSVSAIVTLGLTHWYSDQKHGNWDGERWASEATQGQMLGSWGLWVS